MNYLSNALWQFRYYKSLGDRAIAQVNEEHIEGHTVLEAINRQLAHYPYHIGQIVFLAKVFVGDEWQTISVAKGKSKTYNEKQFSREKEKKNFGEGFYKTEN